MFTFYIKLSKKEAIGLTTLANKELRDPRDQARFIVHQELERRGLLYENADNENQNINKEQEESHE